MTVQIVQRFSGYPGGVAVGVQSNIVTVYAHEDGRTLESGIDTDANGFFTYVYAPEGSAATQWILAPGPIYWSGTYSGDTRIGSTKASGLLGPNSMLELPSLFKAWGNGVIAGAVTGDFAVTYDAAGLDVDVAAGRYNIDGIWITNPASRELNIAAADATHPRIDRIILELTRTAGNAQGKCVLKVLAGTAAASPTAPTLTDNASTLQVSLAQVRVNAAATTVASVTDERTYTLTSVSRHPVIQSVGYTAPGATAVTSTGTSIAALQHTPTLVSGVTYDISMEADIVGYANAGSLEIACFIDGVGNVGSYMSHQTATLTGLYNVHISTIVGTGASITAGVLIRESSGGDAGYHRGVSTLRAIPRN